MVFLGYSKDFRGSLVKSLVNQFDKDKNDDIAKSRPQAIDSTLIGWGGWSSPKAWELHVVSDLSICYQNPEEDENCCNLIINEDDNAKGQGQLQVSELPFPAVQNSCRFCSQHSGTHPIFLHLMDVSSLYSILNLCRIFLMGIINQSRRSNTSVLRYTSRGLLFVVEPYKSLCPCILTRSLKYRLSL